MGADLLLQRSAHGDSVHCSRSGEGVRSILRLAVVTSYLLFVSPFLRSRGVFFAPVVFSRAAGGLRQFSGLRLLLSFFCKRKRPHFRPLAGMSKAIPGRRSPSPEAAPPPARSSCIPESVIRCLRRAPEMGCCDIAYNAALK